MKKMASTTKRDDKDDKPWHLVFDLDGTLLDTLEDITLGANRAMADFNPNAKQFELAQVKRMVGDGARILVQRLLSASEKRSPQKDEIDRCHKLFLEKYSQCLTEKTRPYPKVMETLNKLKAELPNAHFLICTNKAEGLARELVAWSELNEIFPRHAVTGSAAGCPQKPDPHHVLRAVDEFIRGSLLDPERTIIIGDGANDILLAHELGCRCIAVTYGFSESSVLHSLQPTAVAADFDQVGKLIIEWVKSADEYNTS